MSLPVDKAFCINLDRRPEKWHRTRELLSGVGIFVERWPACDGGSRFVTEAHTAIGTQYIKRVGALGCLMSHHALILHAKHAGYKRIAVFEDDVLPALDFDYDKISQLPPWQFVYLGATQWDWDVEIKNGYYHPHRTLGTWAMMIDCSLYDAILTAYEQLNLTADMALSTILTDHPKAFVLSPGLFISDLTISDIRPWPAGGGFPEMYHWNPQCYASQKYSTESG